MRKILTIILAAAMILALGTAAFASGEASAAAAAEAPAEASGEAAASGAAADAWGEYNMENDGYGYLTANFPSTYPADIVEGEGEQVVVEKTDAILLTMTDAEKQAMVNAFAADGVSWSGLARMGIPAVYEGASVSAAEVFTSFDAVAITEALSEYALLARADGFNALRLVGLEGFPEGLAAAAEELFSEAMSGAGVIALTAESGASGETDARISELFAAIGAAGYLQYMQVSRDGLAALDTTPPPSIEPEAIEYTKPLEPGESGIILPDGAKAGESFEIVAMGPVEAVSAMLRDESGENLPIDDMLKENLGDSLRFTFTVTFDAPTSMPIYLYIMTTEGWETAPAASAQLEVK